MKTQPDLIEATVKVITALLISIARNPSAPAGKAFQSALTRHGHNLHDTVGPEALDTVRARIKFEAPDRFTAEERDRIIATAWQGITGSEDEMA